MRDIIVFNMITLDGFVAGPGGDISWHNAGNEEFNDFAIKQLDTAGGLIFGRVTYEMMAGYWPHDDDDPEVASRMNAIDKYVVSNTLQRADWNNTHLLGANFPDALAEAKRQPGKDLFVFGSATLCASLANHGLIDEYRLIVNPVVLGEGQPMFGREMAGTQLKLVSSRQFESGNVLLTYRTTAS